jgi:hypothetical protein
MINLAGFGRQRVHELHHAKFAAQALRKANELNWKPMQFIASPGSSVQAVLKVVGFGQERGRDDRAVLQGAGRSRLGEGPGDAGLLRLHEEVRGQRLRARCDRRVGLRQRADGRARLQGGQERTDAREPAQAGDHAQGRHPADAAARHGALQHPEDYRAYHGFQLSRFDGKGWAKVEYIKAD